MRSKVDTLVSAQFFSSSKISLAKDVSKDTGASLTGSLTLDDCSILASSAVESVDMSSFRSARRRQERMNAARSSMEPNIHSSSLSEAWRQRRLSAFSSTPPTRSTALQPPSPSLQLRPSTTPSQIQYPTNMSDSLSPLNGPRRFIMAGEEAVPLSRVMPGPVWPTTNQLKVAYMYGIQREDGTYTRLIRADELDSYDFERVSVSQGPEGMIVLPPLQQPRPEQREGPEIMVSNEVSTRSIYQ